MYSFPFPAPATVSLPIDDRRFPVRRVYCVGRNYAAHAREMGHDPERDPPFFFQKNPDNLVSGPDVPYPSATSNLHHEIELVVALKSGGASIPPGDANRLIFGYAVGLDLTRRDLQEQAKKLAQPWTAAKAFEASAPIGTIAPAERLPELGNRAMTLSVNGQRKQTGELSQMIWSVPEIISQLSQLFTLAPGDLIFTGTPDGVGPVVRGDRLEAYISGLDPLKITLV